MDPLILTARFAPDVQEWLQQQRDAYFPRELNVVPAHLTLFHALPGEEQAWIAATIRDAAPAEPLDASIADVRSLGRGGAYVVRSEALDALRGGLARRFGDRLTSQDRQGFRAHVTYQNKVTKARAQRDYETILREFAPVSTTIVGLDLWWYRGGPWELAAAFEF